MASLMNRIKGWGPVGAVVGLVAAVVAKYYPQDGLLNINLKLAQNINLDVASKLSSGLDTTLGEKVFGFFNGLIPIEGNVWIMAALAGAILMIVGRYLLDLIPIFKPSTKVQKMALVLLYGSLAVSLYLGFLTPGLNLTFGSVLGTMILYYLILAVLSALVLSQTNMKVPE